jgi:hypothetical protein
MQTAFNTQPEIIINKIEHVSVTNEKQMWYWEFTNKQFCILF